MAAMSLRFESGLEAQILRPLGPNLSGQGLSALCFVEAAPLVVALEEAFLISFITVL